MPTKIINLQIVLQSRVSPKARKEVVRKDSADGPWRNRKIDIALDLPTGPDSGANFAVRKLIVDTLKKRTGKGEILFYAIAEFEESFGPGKSVQRYFKTIAPRREIPIQFRRV